MLGKFVSAFIYQLVLGVPLYLLVTGALSRYARRKGRCHNCRRRQFPRFTELRFHTVPAPGVRLPRGMRTTNIDPLDGPVELWIPPLCDTVTIRQYPHPPIEPDKATGAVVDGTVSTREVDAA